MTKNIVTSDVWLDSLDTEAAETVVTSEGSRYSFNNDGTAHYLEFIDVTRKEPNGRYKRVYKGKIKGGHVSYKGVTSELECSAEYTRWQQTPYGRKRKDNRVAGKDERRDA